MFDYGLFENLLFDYVGCVGFELYVCFFWWCEYEFVGFCSFCFVDSDLFIDVYVGVLLCEFVDVDCICVLVLLVCLLYFCGGCFFFFDFDDVFW